MPVSKFQAPKLIALYLSCLFSCCGAKAQGLAESAALNSSVHGASTKLMTDSLSKIYNRKQGFFSINNTGKPEKIFASPSAGTRLSPDEIKTAVNESNKLCSLAVAKEKAGKINEAEGLYYKAAAIRSKIWGNYDPAVAKLCLQIGRLESKQGHSAIARSWYKQTLSALSKHFGSGDYELVPALSQLAILEAKAGNHIDAQSYYEHILSLQERKFGEDGKECQKARISLIEESIAAKDISEAKRLHKKECPLKKRKVVSIAKIIRSSSGYCKGLMPPERMPAVNEFSYAPGKRSLTFALSGCPL